MNDIRRTILWVIFGFSLVLLWDQWQVYNGHKPTFLPSTKAVAPANAPVAPTSSASGVPDPAASTSSGSVPAQGAPTVAGEKVTVSTDVFKAVLDAQGGTLSQLQLLQYVDQTNTNGLVEHVRRLFGYPVAQNEAHPVTLMGTVRLQRAMWHRPAFSIRWTPASDSPTT